MLPLLLLLHLQRLSGSVAATALLERAAVSIVAWFTGVGDLQCGGAESKKHAVREKKVKESWPFDSGAAKYELSFSHTFTLSFEVDFSLFLSPFPF